MQEITKGIQISRKWMRGATEGMQVISKGMKRARNWLKEELKRYKDN
jgi:hypothetical protein